MSALRKKLFRLLKNFRFLPIPVLLKIRYASYTGKKLNLNSPVEFNEKLNWLKLYYHPPILTQLADKYAVRAYVSEKIGSEYLNEIYGKYYNVDEINFENLPNQFVLKAVHGSSTNLIVKDKNLLNIEKTKKILNKWLKHNQYKKVGYEWAYKNIKPAIIIEKYLNENNKIAITDYKFNCFNGKAEFVQCIFEHEGIISQAYFDKNFILTDYNRYNEKKWAKKQLDKPFQYEKMLELAEKLAGNFPFARVDFYYVENRIIFGEITFYPGDGKYDFVPDKYNKIFGNMIKLPLLEKGQKEITNYP